MHTNQPSKQEDANLVKFHLFEAIRARRIKQEVIARILDVNQSTVSRMTSPDNDINIAVYQLKLLYDNEFTRGIAEEMLQSIGGRFTEFELDPTDGNLLDEFLEATNENGKFAEIMKDGVQKSEHKKLLQIANNFEKLASHIRAEVSKLKVNESK